MAITALGYDPSAILQRAADVYIGIGEFSGDDLLYSLGAVRDVSNSFEPINSTPDSHGRTIVRGYTMTLTFIVMQTRYSIEMVELLALVVASPLMLKVTDAIVAYAQGPDLPTTQQNASTAAHAAAGVELQNATISVAPNFNYNGDESVLTVTTTARLSIAQMAQIGVSTVVIGNA